MRKFRLLVMLLSALFITACAEENKKTTEGEDTSETLETTSKSEGIIDKSDGIAGNGKLIFGM